MRIYGDAHYRHNSLPGGSARCVQVCIVFTDGNPSGHEPERVPAASKAWAGIGATMFAVGIGEKPTEKGNKRLALWVRIEKIGLLDIVKHY